MKFANLKLFLLISLLIPVAANANTGLNNQSASETNASDPETIVDAALRKTFARSFRIRGVTTSFLGTSSEELAYAGPDRYQVVSSFEDEEGIQMVTETIVIGKDVYTKKAGQWKKEADGTSPVNSVPTGDYVKALADQKPVVKFVGSDTLGGLGMQVYEVHYPFKDADVSIKFWVGDEDRLLHRMRTVAKSSSGNISDEEPIEVISTIDYYDFGADIKVEAPV